MAATLAGVCRVPLTSVLLLFELTQDYRIVLPLLGAVGLSSWIASPQRFSTSSKGKLDFLEEKTNTVPGDKMLSSQTQQVTAVGSVDSTSDLCKLESSLCVYDARDDNMLENLTVTEAMKTRYIAVSVNTTAVEALNLMLTEKQPFVMITESNESLVGLLTLKDFQDFCKTSKTTRMQTKVRIIVCTLIFLSLSANNRCRSCFQMPILNSEPKAYYTQLTLYATLQLWYIKEATHNHHITTMKLSS